MKTKILTLLIAVIVNIGVVSAWEYNHVKIGNLYYDLVGYGAHTGGDGYREHFATVVADNSYVNLTTVTIPSTVTYDGDTYYVNKIGRLSFADCSNLKNVTFDAPIEVMEHGAFSGCIGLTTIALPSSVSEIGTAAFKGCTNLTSINIPDKVGNIGWEAFYNCTALLSVTVPNNNLRYVGTDAFYNVGNVNYLPNELITVTGAESPWGARMLNGYVEGSAVYIDGSKKTLMACSSNATGTFVIPNSVTSIHNRAFYGCKGLTGISIPNTVTKIWNNVFYGCAGLTSLTIPNSVTSIGAGAFEGCTSLKSMTIPNSVTSLGDSAFVDCQKMTSVEIPSSINTIGNKFFYNCKSLTSFTIPESITSIGSHAFGNCSSMKTIIVPDNVTNVEDYAFENCIRLESVRFGKKIAKMNVNIFYNCPSLTEVEWNIPSLDNFGFPYSKISSITFGDAVQRIPANICEGQTNLLKAVLSDKITVIGDNAFNGCTTLAIINFPNALQKIKSNAFKNTPLNSITIPVNVNEIGAGAFSGCNPKIVNWNADGSTLDPTNMDLGNRLEQVNLGEKVKVIHPYLFQKQTKITELYIPSGYIRVGAFMDCTGLKKLTLGANVTKLDASAFKGCVNIAGALVLSDALDTIPTGVFDNCKKITSVTIGKNVKKISGFSGCTGIKVVYNFSYMSLVPHSGGVDNPAYYADRVYNNMDRQGDFIFSGKALMGYTGSATDITLPATYKNSSYTIGSGAFAGATQLTSVTIPEAVTAIESSAFEGCTGLTSITAPNGVTEIGEKAFSGCSNIKEFSLGGTLQKLGTNALANCTSVQEITCSAQTPPTAYTNSFTNVPSSAKLYIPGGSLNAYKSAQGWSYFTNVTETNLVKTTGVSLSAATLTLKKGDEAVLYAKVSPSNASYKTVTWSSSNTNVASVNEKGVVYGRNAGKATITCTTTNGGYTASCEVTVVTDAIKATGLEFYKSAYMKNGNNVVPYSKMNANDTLIFMELATGFIDVHVLPYSVTNGEINYTVSDPSIVSAELTSHINFSNSIRLNPQHPGVTKITFTTTDGSNISQDVFVRITPDPTVKVTGIRILKREITLAAKERDTVDVQIFPNNATNQSVTWSSDKPTAANVLKDVGSNRGIIEAKNLGVTGVVNITCTTADGNYSDVIKVNVIQKRVHVTGLSLNYTFKKLAIGKTLQLNPSITPVDATNTQVYWWMDNDTVVTLQNGLVKAIREGSVTITCITEDGGYEASCVITVTDGSQSDIPVTGVTLNKKTLQMVIGETETLKVSVLPEDASDNSVTWKSSNASVATVSTSGVVSAKAEGVSTVSCETNDGHYKAECYVVVSEANSAYDYSFEPTTQTKIQYEASNVSLDEMPSNGCVFISLVDDEHALYLMYVGSLVNGSIPAGTYPVSSSLQIGTICYSIGGDDTSDYGSFMATNFDSNGNYTAAYYIIAGSVIVGKNDSYYAKLVSANGSDIEVTYKGSTDIEDVKTMQQSAKILHNGQLYILRDGHIYTVQGLEVR